MGLALLVAPSPPRVADGADGLAQGDVRDELPGREQELRVRGPRELAAACGRDENRRNQPRRVGGIKMNHASIAFLLNILEFSQIPARV